jgi:hypothetical protein
MMIEHKRLSPIANGSHVYSPNNTSNTNPKNIKNQDRTRSKKMKT